MEDEEIVKLLSERDETALKQLEVKYGGYCRSIAKNILLNSDDAEECVNDVFLKVWNTVPPAAPKYLTPFIARITRNTAINLYKQNHRQKRGGGETPLPFDELEELIGGISSVESDVEKKELLAAINRFLSKQNKRKRLLFIGRYWYCLTAAQLAESLGMSEHNVTVSLCRIREKLKEYLKKEGFYYG